MTSVVRSSTADHRKLALNTKAQPVQSSNQSNHQQAQFKLENPRAVIGIAATGIALGVGSTYALMQRRVKNLTQNLVETQTQLSESQRNNSNLLDQYRAKLILKARDNLGRFSDSLIGFSNYASNMTISSTNSQYKPSIDLPNFVKEFRKRAKTDDKSTMEELFHHLQKAQSELNEFKNLGQVNKEHSFMLSQIKEKIHDIKVTLENFDLFRDTYDNNRIRIKDDIYSKHLISLFDAYRHIEGDAVSEIEKARAAADIEVNSIFAERNQILQKLYDRTVPMLNTFESTVDDLIKVV